MLRAQNLDLGQAPGWGWRVGDSLPPTPARGYNSWQKWNGRQGVVGVGEIMEGLPLGLAGLGAGTAQQIALSVPSMVGGVLTAGGTTTFAAGTVVGGSSIGASIFGAAAVPIIGIAVVGVTIALMLIFSRKGPKQKTESTHIVEALIAQLQDNLAAYMSGPRTQSSQQQALNNFDAGWTWLVSDQGCGNPELGDPGHRCISERQRGGIYDMWKDLRDPIANDPQVKPDPVAGGPVDGSGTSTVIGPDGTVQQVPTTGGGGLLDGGNGSVLLLAAAALVVVAFMGDK